jgi:uncharacterized tellurite resistance protein B-like protein
MIIFGTRGLTSTKDSGTFYCPVCAGRQPYKHKKARRFFTLYFIPLIPLDALGEFVECQACRGTYRPELLQHDPESEAEHLESEYHRAMRQVMLHMMLADGEIHDSEIDAISDIYQKLTGHALTPEDVRREAAAITEPSMDQPHYLIPFAGLLNDQGKELVVKAAFLVAASDGDLAEQEMAFLSAVGGCLQMSQPHLRGVVQELMQSVCEEAQGA